MIKVELNDADFKYALEKLEQATADLTPALKLIGRKLVESTEQRFEAGVAPDGTTWMENSPDTIEDKGHDKPLIGGTGERMTQMMQRQNHAQVKGNVLTVGNTMEYSAMQHFGGTKANYPHLWGDIPARPFIGLSADDREMVIEQVTDAIERAWRSK